MIRRSKALKSTSKDTVESIEETFEVELLNNPTLLEFAQGRLNQSGELCQSPDGFTYLRLNNDFIYSLCPLLERSDVEIPPYFSAPHSAGAHITVVYPEEWPGERVPLEEVGQVFNFLVKELYRSSLRGKTFFVVTIECPELKKIRVKYGLPSELNYHGFEVEFHITIGILKGN